MGLSSGSRSCFGATPKSDLILASDPSLDPDPAPNRNLVIVDKIGVYKVHAIGMIDFFEGRHLTVRINIKVSAIRIH